MEINFFKKLELAIVRFEKKYNFFFRFEELKNENYILLWIEDYCFYVFKKDEEKFLGVFYQTFKEGLFENESDYFVGFTKLNETQTFCNIYDKDGKQMLVEKDFTFVYPVGVVRGTNYLVLAEKQIEKDYKITYVFDIRNQFVKKEVKKIKNLDYFNEKLVLEEIK